MIELTEKDMSCGCARQGADADGVRAYANHQSGTQITVNGDSFPVAMAYVRWQKLDRVYPHELALERGTLFPELDKPFCGMTVTGGRKW